MVKIKLSTQSGSAAVRYKASFLEIVTVKIQSSGKVDVALYPLFSFFLGFSNINLLKMFVVTISNMKQQFI